MVEWVEGTAVQWFSLVIAVGSITGAVTGIGNLIVGLLNRRDARRQRFGFQPRRK
jgi:hypothetical protein